MRQRGFDNPKWRVNIRLHRRVEIFGRNIEDRLTRLLPGGVADQNVESVELLNRIGDEFFAKIFIPQIARNRDSFSPGLFNQRDNFVGIRLLGGKIINCDIGAFARECNGGGTPYSRVAAGHQRFATCESSAAPITFLPVIRARLHLARQAWPRLRLLFERRFRIFVFRIFQFLSCHRLMAFLRGEQV